MTNDINHTTYQELDMRNLRKDSTYLIRYNHMDSLSSITILMVTGKAYHIRWNNSPEPSFTWETIEHMYDKYRLIEDISDQIKPISNKINFDTNTLEKEFPIPKTNLKLITCPICRGIGTVPDMSTSTMKKPCPLCMGSKMIPDSMEISS